MILKSIEMQGFKSFADKIYLDFNSGITAIVGPNGSGKSNISDAIRWVMGEQSIKSLRGSRMEDVIFAGTAQRKPLGFAEVTLCLDNSEGYFDLDFPEIVVTRRVYRSGESEYYINKTLCRLKDIHELFMDTGLGRDGYSIIGQGQIENILSTKSEDRRQIFEEASGISKYKYRKIEAERKLARTTENLTRVEDILGELETQIGPLKRQSEKAKKYLVYEDELRDLEINVSVINIEKKRASLDKLKTDIEVYESQIGELRQKIDNNDQKVAALYEKAEESDKDAEVCRERDRELNERTHEIRSRVSLIGSDIEHSRSMIDRLHSELEEGEKHAAELSTEAGELIKRRAALASRSEALQESEKDLGSTAKELGIGVSQKSREIEALREKIAEKKTETAGDRNAISGFEILKENIASRQNAVRDELKSRNSDIAVLTEKVEKLKSDIDGKSRDISDLKNEINRLEEIYGEKSGEIQKLVAKRNNSNILLGQLTARRKTLYDMEQGLEGYSRGVKSVMTAHKQGRLGGCDIRGPLSQLIKTDKKYVTAIETALGGAAQNIVTGEADDAKTAIGYLKKNNSGRATFLPISDIKPKNISNNIAKACTGYIAAADELVRCADEYRDTVSHVLGSTVVADNLDNAVIMGRKCGHKFRIVTLGGDIIQAGGAITGGSVARSVGSLSRMSEIEDLDKKIRETEKQIAVDAKHTETLSNENSDIMESIRANNEMLSAYNDEHIRMSSELEHTRKASETAGSSREQLTAELHDIENKLSDIDSDIKSKNDSIAKLESEIDALEKKAENEQKLFSELSGKNEELTSALLELSLKRNTVLKDIEQADESIRRIHDEQSQLLVSARDKTAETDKIKKSIEALEAERENLKAEALDIETKTQGVSEELKRLLELRREIEDKIKTQQESVKGIRDDMLNLTTTLAKAQSRQENTEAELDRIISHLWEEYELTYSEIADGRDLSGFDHQAAAKRISELKGLIKGLGSINIDSIDEYKSVSERAAFLREQTDDLKKSKKELLKIIDEMLEIMKTRFSDRFKVINENFGRVFNELFGGGHARLSLTDPDNVLESGIEIEAQPPGKKLQSLTLLSGGEKAFTAIALLFAILNVRPTPFCILDEIEAALDDVNVYRYAEYLKQFCEKTQFIVVTHRRGTMEAANILYGVTMQEKGVSKLLTLNIDEVQE